MNNLELATKILLSLQARGLKQVCLCAGSRNSPFVEVLDHQSTIKVFHFFEERDAAFFAYQQTKEHGILTAVITTSGTAVAELLPATIEAYYKQIPLLLLTADRPKHFRGTGAPQSIEQVGLFSQYATSHDIDIHSDIQWHLDADRPNHINVCFEEPLISGKAPAFVALDEYKPLKKNISQHIFSETIVNPLVIIGDVFSAQEESEILNFVTDLQVPMVVEAISNLRGKFSNNVLRSHDLSVEALLESKKIQSIIRLGGVPTTSVWRRLETKYKHIPVYTFSHSKFSGLSHQTQICSYQKLQISHSYLDEIIESDSLMAAKVQSLYKKYPQAEATLIHDLSQILESEDTLYLGNSLPIREWDLYTPVDLSLHRIGSNRGANGIDGQLSSFLGFSHPHKRNIGIFGDLTTMYDMCGPWILEQLPPHQKHVFTIINNSGGQIFSRMYESKSYINSHARSFESLAAFWRLPYTAMKQIQALPRKNAMVEIFPDPIETELFWKDLRS